MAARLVEYALDADALTQVVPMPLGASVTRLVHDGSVLKVQAFADADEPDGPGFKVWLRLTSEATSRERAQWAIGFAEHDGVTFYGFAQPITEAIEEDSYKPGYVHGAWSSGTGYEVGDQVRHADAVYICRTSQAPP